MAQRNGPRDLPQARVEHPDPWFMDLSPDHLAGQNIGAVAEGGSERSRPASEIKELTRTLHELTDDELAQLTVLTPGARLEAGAAYCDVSDPKRPVIRATADMVVPNGHYLVPKSAIAYEYWNRLVYRDRD